MWPNDGWRPNCPYECSRPYRHMDGTDTEWRRWPRRDWYSRKSAVENVWFLFLRTIVGDIGWSASVLFLVGAWKLPSTQ